MYKNYLSDIDGIAIYPIISLTIFVTFFVLLGYFVFRADKKYIDYMKDMPLNEND